MRKCEAIFWSLAAAVFSFSLTLQAAETTLRISSWASPNHGINAMVWPTWGQWVEEATDGRVDVKVEYNMGPPPAQADLVLDGVADVKKMRVAGDVMTTLAERMGVVPVALPPNKVYEALSQGVVDGAFFTLETLKSFRLNEVAPYTVTFPGGLYRGSFSILMNRDTLDGLSEQDREAILDVSGEKLSRLFGQMMDDADAAGVADNLAKGTPVVDADIQMVSDAKALAVGIEAQWLKQAEDRIKDPGAALDYYREQVAAFSGQ